MSNDETQVTIKLNIDSKEFEKELQRLTKKVGRAVGVPEWCYFPWMRWLVMSSALLGPLVVVAEVVR